MARSFEYNHPTYTVPRSAFTGGVAAVTAGGRMRVPSKALVRAVHLHLTTASVTTAASISVRNNNSTIAVWAIGVAAAGTSRTITLNSTLAALDVMDCIGVANTAAVFDVTWEYYIQARADVT